MDPHEIKMTLGPLRLFQQDWGVSGENLILELTPVFTHLLLSLYLVTEFPFLPFFSFESVWFDPFCIHVLSLILPSRLLLSVKDMEKMGPIYLKWVRRCYDLPSVQFQRDYLPC